MDLWLIGGGGWGQSVMKIMQCNRLPEIHAQLTRGSIGVVVFHGPVIDWRGVGSVCHENCAV